MTAALLFLALLSVMEVSQSAPIIPEDQPYESMDISEFIPSLKDDFEMSLEYGDIAVSKGSLKNADPCTAAGCRWPKHGQFVSIPFYISPDYTREEVIVIFRGLLSFHVSTCIRFVPWNKNVHDFIYFQSKKGCWSKLGRQNGGQYISLQRNACLSRRTVQHEVLHALGFHHEQSRSDRDDYVLIETQNIKPNEIGNFNKTLTNNLGTPYDFSSVMHYGKYAFSKNGKPTIFAKADCAYDWGRASRMSANDIIRINKLYKC